MNPVHQEGSADPVQDEYADLVRSAATGDAEALDRVMGISENSVKTRLHRARAQLQADLGRGEK